jgi:hypothetical protein
MMLFMALNPDAQAKCREELDTVCGKHNVSLDDESNLIYLRVTLKGFFLDSGTKL